MALQEQKAFGVEPGLTEYRLKSLGLERLTGVPRNRGCAPVWMANSHVGAARADDCKPGAQQFCEHLIGGDAWKARHPSILARDGHLDALEERAVVAFRNWKPLGAQVHDAEGDRIARVRERFLDRFAFGDHAGQRGDDGGVPALRIRLENDGESAAFVHGRLFERHTPSIPRACTGVKVRRGRQRGRAPRRREMLSPERHPRARPLNQGNQALIGLSV